MTCRLNNAREEENNWPRARAPATGRFEASGAVLGLGGASASSSVTSSQAFSVTVRAVRWSGGKGVGKYSHRRPYANVPMYPLSSMNVFSVSFFLVFFILTSPPRNESMAPDTGSAASSSLSAVTSFLASFLAFFACGHAVASVRANHRVGMILSSQRRTFGTGDAAAGASAAALWAAGSAFGAAAFALVLRERAVRRLPRGQRRARGNGTQEVNAYLQRAHLGLASSSESSHCASSSSSLSSTSGAGFRLPGAVPWH